MNKKHAVLTLVVFMFPLYAFASMATEEQQVMGRQEFVSMLTESSTKGVTIILKEIRHRQEVLGNLFSVVMAGPYVG